MVLACLGGALYQSLHFTVNIMTKMIENMYDDQKKTYDMERGMIKNIFKNVIIRIKLLLKKNWKT